MDVEPLKEAITVERDEDRKSEVSFYSRPWDGDFVFPALV